MKDISGEMQDAVCAAENAWETVGCKTEWQHWFAVFIGRMDVVTDPAPLVSNRHLLLLWVWLVVQVRCYDAKERRLVWTV